MSAAYHYCCAHSERGIDTYGVVLPSRQIWTDTPLSWWTTLAEPDRIGLGLTSTILTCDRTERRYEAASGSLTPWRMWALIARVPTDVVDMLEHVGSRPDTWLVATQPIPVRVSAGAS